MRYRYAEIQDRVTAALLDEGLDIADAAFELERRGHPIARLVGVGRVALAVEVDEPGRHHQPADVDDHCTGQRSLRDRIDPVAANADVAHRVEAGFRVEHSAASQHDVEAFAGLRAGGRR